MAKKAAPTKKTATASKSPAPKGKGFKVGDVVVFKKYAEEQDDPLLVEGEYVKIVEDRGAVKGGGHKYAVEPLEKEDDDGEAREGDTVYLSEIRALKGDEIEEAETLIAQSEDSDEEEDEDEDADEEEDEDEEDEDDSEEDDDGDEDEDSEEEDEDSDEDEDEDADEDEDEDADDEDEEDEDEEDEDEDEESEDLDADAIEALGEEADAGDQDAADKLSELAAEHDLDPNDSSEYPDWSALASAINDAIEESEEDSDEDEEEEEAPKKGKVKGGKSSAKKTGKKAAKKNQLQLTASVQEALEEFGEDALAAAKQIETDIESKFMTLGGVIAFGAKTNAHLSVVDKKTKKPLYAKGKKGFFEWVKDNLSTEARTARHLARIYTELVAKHGVDEERLQSIGITKLREIVGVVTADNLEGLLQLCEKEGLTVRDIVTHVRNDYRSGGGSGGGDGESKKVVKLDFRLFEDQAVTANAVLEHATKQLPEAGRNKDAAFFSILTEYANAVGFKLPKVKKSSKSAEKETPKKSAEKPSKKKVADKKKSKA